MQFHHFPQVMKSVKIWCIVRELLAYVARARGKLKKGGIPDMRAAACVVIQDFNQGMIPFYIKPPKYMLDHM